MGLRRLRVRCRWFHIGETQRAELLDSLAAAQRQAHGWAEQIVKRPILVDVTFGLVDGEDGDYQMTVTYISLTGDADVPITTRVDAVFSRRIRLPE